MFADVVGDITASDQSETVMCRELAEALAELWRTFGRAFELLSAGALLHARSWAEMACQAFGHRHRGHAGP